MKLKNFFLIFFSMVVLLSMTVSASAIDSSTTQDGVFTFEVAPEKNSYEKGETVVFKSCLYNNTLYDIENAVVSVEIPQDDVFFTARINEREYNDLKAGSNAKGEYKIYENETVNKVAAVLVTASSGLLIPLVFWLLKAYSSASAKIVSAILIVSSAFGSFSGFSQAFNSKYIKEKSFCSCKYVYDGKEYTAGFNIFYQLPNDIKKASYHEVESVKDSFTYDAVIKFSMDGYNGLVFGTKIDNDKIEGCMYCINPENGTVSLFYSDMKSCEKLAEKYVDIKKDTAYKMKLTLDSGRLKAWLYNNPADKNPYPIFDVQDNRFTADKVGYVLTEKSTASSFNVYDGQIVDDEKTYTNPVKTNLADPYVLKYDGVYYLYGTHENTTFHVYTSTDLVNWSDGTVCGKSENMLGSTWFWAPEVYEYKGKFYMLYSAEECLALAVSDSPYGPFTATTNEFLVKKNENGTAIDGHILFDDDGRIYMYYSRGNKMWGCEMNSDLLSIKPETNKLLFVSENWEKGIVEAPILMKHNGLYYMTYSGVGYLDNNYDTGLAISKTPLGEFVKYKNNPIFSSDSYIHGCGHASITYSPDDTEMIYVYHCHNTLDMVQERKICIDRIKFTPTENGYDILTIYGPTVTSQPMPSGAK